MKKPLWILTLTGLAAAMVTTAGADSTINATDKHAYGANIGWINFKHDQPAAPEGAVVGEFVCSGFVYSANCGWINLGDGTPVNGHEYQNNAANDFGVNVTGHSSNGVTCEADLRGFAYGANIGWINFEAQGDPRVDLATGEFKGYAYSANCGWINLGEGGMTPVKTDAIQEGPDTDADGITDAFEFAHAGDLVTMTALTDSDGDGTLDVKESIADTDPFDIGDFLEVTAFSGGDGSPLSVTFTSKESRKYIIKEGNLLAPFTDVGLGTFAPDAGATTTKGGIATIPQAEYFWIVEAKKPLVP